jgi:hypothetical protein
MDEKQALKLLKSLLERKGAGWTEEAGFLRFRARRDGMLWELACRAREGELLIYARFPFSCRKPEEARSLCERANRTLTRGALFLGEDGAPVYRIRAELDDVYGAEERVEKALAFSAQVTARYWGPLSGT